MRLFLLLSVNSKNITIIKMEAWLHEQKNITHPLSGLNIDYPKVLGHGTVKSFK